MSHSLFPREIAREIESAAKASDASARRSHIELAALHYMASDGSPANSEAARNIVRSAVLSRVAFTNE